MQGSLLGSGALAACLVAAEGHARTRAKVLECRACGLVFVQPRAPADAACRRCRAVDATVALSSAA